MGKRFILASQNQHIYHFHSLKVQMILWSFLRNRHTRMITIRQIPKNHNIELLRAFYLHADQFIWWEIPQATWRFCGIV